MQSSRNHARRRLPLSGASWAALCVAFASGAFAGLGGYTFAYARGASYLTNDPAACANCHVMDDHYSAWMKSSHRSVATCNDCHTPNNLLGKYATKASNGFFHSLAFTTGDFPQPLRIKPRNREIVEQACRKCHADLVEPLVEPESLACVRCHASVGHLSLSAGAPGAARR